VPIVDLVDEGVELVAKLGRETTACAPLTTSDRALTIIAARHEVSN
jgi:hypothetical protein